MPSAAACWLIAAMAFATVSPVVVVKVTLADGEKRVQDLKIGGR